jgi:hypothetical protein
MLSPSRTARGESNILHLLIFSCSLLALLFLILWSFLTIHYRQFWSLFMFIRLCSWDFLLLYCIALLEELVCFLLYFLRFDFSLFYFYNSVENYKTSHQQNTDTQNYQTFHIFINFFLFFATAPSGPGPPLFPKFPDHKQRYTTVGRTPLDQWSARRKDLYLKTHNTPNRQTYMLPVGFEPSISAAAVDLRLIPRDHWDRLISSRICNKSSLAVST